MFLIHQNSITAQINQLSFFSAFFKFRVRFVNSDELKTRSCCSEAFCRTTCPGNFRKIHRKTTWRSTFSMKLQNKGAYQKTWTRDLSGTLAGLYKIWKTGTPDPMEPWRYPTETGKPGPGTLEKVENQDPSGTLRKSKNRYRRGALRLEKLVLKWDPRKTLQL